jgi:hypothetical protein
MTSAPASVSFAYAAASGVQNTNGASNNQRTNEAESPPQEVEAGPL